MRNRLLAIALFAPARRPGRTMQRIMSLRRRILHTLISKG